MPLFTKSLKLKSFNNKRFGRYLLYALGELILVVAGILIAAIFSYVVLNSTVTRHKPNVIITNVFHNM